MFTDDEDIRVICQHIPHLEELDLLGSHLTDISLDYLADMKNLKRLSLYGAYKLTEPGLIKFMQFKRSVDLEFKLEGTKIALLRDGLITCD